MGYINEGIFKKFHNEFQNLDSDYKNLIDRYFSKAEYCDYLEFCGDFEDFFDFSYSADIIFNNANDFVKDVNKMKDCITLKTEESNNRFDYELNEAIRIMEEILSYFKSTLSLIENSEPLSGIDLQTLQKLRIYYVTHSS